MDQPLLEVLLLLHLRLGANCRTQIKQLHVDPLADMADYSLSASPSAFPVPEAGGPASQPFGPPPDPAAGPNDDSLTDGLFQETLGEGSSSGDVASGEAVAGVGGFRNLGNTCYMNSGLQCLIATPALVEVFLGLEVAAGQELGLVRTFSELVRQVYSGQYTVIQPDGFREAVGAQYAQFQGFRQHDAQEFLTVILDSLHEQLAGLGGRTGDNLRTASECTRCRLGAILSTG
jgi:hypothetical protein